MGAQKRPTTGSINSHSYMATDTDDAPTNDTITRYTTVAITTRQLDPHDSQHTAALRSGNPAPQRRLPHDKISKPYNQ